MNKDVDERLVPNGEYRDAMNIQVSTSEESDVGTIQNVLGNDTCCIGLSTIGDNSFTVGSISDEKNDILYWFVSNQDYLSSSFAANVTNWNTVNFMSDEIWSKSTYSDNCQIVFRDKFAFSQLNTSTANSNILTGVSPAALNELEIGWTVQGVNSNGTTSNLTIVTNIGDVSTISVLYGSTPNTQTVNTSTFVGPNYNPMVTVGSAVLIPMSPTFTPFGQPTTFNQSSSNTIYIQGFSGSASALVGDQIEILPNTVNSQTFIIQSASTVQISNPSTGMGISVVEIILDSNVNVFNNPSLAQPSAFAAGSNIPHSFILSGNIIDAEITSTSNITQNIATGELIIDINDYDVSTFTIGQAISLNGQTGGCIQSINVANNSIVLADCVTGVVYSGWQVGGFLFGTPQPTGGFIIVATNLTVTTLDPLNLSAGYESLIFSGPRTLNFNHNEHITGINIIDDMLFWTDGKTEPKKINIPRSIEGTTGVNHTRLINEAKGIDITSNVLAREEHITVIRKAPKSAMSVDLVSTRDSNLNYSGVVTISDSVNLGASTLWDQRAITDPAKPYDFSTFTTEEGNNIIRIIVKEDLLGNSNFELDGWGEAIGTKVVLREFDNVGNAPSVPINDYVIKGVVTDWLYTNPTTGVTSDVNSLTSSATWGVKVAIKITSISGTPATASSFTNGELNYAIDLFDETEKLFEFKFPRFSYRYKYEDGEYSSFAPFTRVAFVPGSFDYHPKKGYNLGMTNNIKEIILKDFVTEDQPEDVVEIDLLYKEEVAPNVYLIETVKPDAEKTIKDGITGVINNHWELNRFKIEKEHVKSSLNPNQLLRPYDNVPKKALAQEVTGNRIVYANYEQNYDLKIGNEYYDTLFTSPKFIHVPGDSRSIKSLREYQLGVVFTDKYGRETPVISNNSGTFKVEKDQASKQNKLQLGISNRNVPEGIEYFKFYIKETSGEYYNMAMDRYWDAEDGNVWVSFASTDRNKIDIDSFLILKKGVESSELIKEPARYKVIAIENEAPDFIKINKKVISDKAHDSGSVVGSNIFFTGVGDIPTEDVREFKIRYYDITATPNDVYSNTGIKNLHKQDPSEGEIYFQLTNNDASIASTPMRVAKIEVDCSDEDFNDLGDDINFVIQLELPFDSTINQFTDDLQGVSSTEILDGTRVVFWNYKPENSPEFDGRFFVKIFQEDVFTEYIVNNLSETSRRYRIEEVQKVYGFNRFKHNKALDGGDTYSSTTLIPNFKNRIGWGDDNPTWHKHIDRMTYMGTSWGSSGSKWKAHQAFFRGINIHYASRSTGNGVPGPAFKPHAINKRKDFEQLDLENYPTGLEIFEFEDVWFIDSELSAGFFTPHWGDTINNIDHNAVGIVPSVNGNSFIELGFGGLQPVDDGTGMPWDFEYNGDINTMKSVYNLEDNGNYNQAGGPMDLVNELATGTLFRWKEDPTGQVFEVNDDDSYRLIRHEAEPNLEAHRDTVLGLQYSTYGTGVDPKYLPTTWYQPHNYSRNYKLKFDDYVNPGTAPQWNPNVYGEITNGISMSLTTASTAGGGAMAVGGNSVTVTSLIDPSSNYGDQKVQIGMVWDYGDTSGNAAIIEKIIGNTLYFKSYNGNNPSVEFPAISSGDTLSIKQYGLNGLSRNSVRNINYFNGGTGFQAQNTGVGAVGYNIEILTRIRDEEATFPRFPAIFETEPKDNTELDIYYEVTDNQPVSLNNKTIKTLLPLLTRVYIITNQTQADGTNQLGFSTPYLIIDNFSITGNQITLNQDLSTFFIDPGDTLKVTSSNGDVLEFEISSLSLTANAPSVSIITLRKELVTQKITSTWHNCYSFGNGVESNRIRDNFNQTYIANGVKASSTIDAPYKLENRKYGLIFSGIYNSMTGINELNQFIQAEKITKDINPIYGSIQKLHSRDTDLITLCEDKVLKILANKDAVFNADGNPQLTANERVLGQTVPFVGEYGISKNPESFASQAYRAYFTDKVRGKVMRLSMDGLTPISDHGMKNWFRDNLKFSNKLVGSHDDRKEEYNITLDDSSDSLPKTVSFKEDVKGWVSFKSFFPENGISCAYNYYTFKKGVIWKHHDEDVDRNRFYGAYNESSFKVILNEAPSSIKSFTTLNYEGSQSMVNELTNITIDNVSYTDNEYYNLSFKPGWFVGHIETDQDKGTINEFIEKENKWFNYIKGKQLNVNNFVAENYDGANFAHQGIGIMSSAAQNITVYGCTDPTMFNYDAGAMVDDGSCIPINEGCTDPNAFNYNSINNVDNGTCGYYGCTDNTTVDGAGLGINGALNYNSQATDDDGSCQYCFLGCTDSSQSNYNSQATCDDGSCLPYTPGCLDSTNSNVANFNVLANIDDGSCDYYGCVNPVTTDAAGNPYNSAVNFLWDVDTYGTEYIDNNGNSLACVDVTTNNLVYSQVVNSSSYNNNLALINQNVNLSNPLASIPPCASISDGSCVFEGCTDNTAINFDSQATALQVDSCVFCADTNAFNYDDYQNVYTGQGTSTASCQYCPEVTNITTSNVTTNSFDITWDNPTPISPPPGLTSPGQNGVYKVIINWGVSSQVPPYLSNLPTNPGGGYTEYDPYIFATTPSAYPSITDNGNGTLSVTISSSTPWLVMGAPGIASNTEYSIAIDTFCTNDTGQLDSSGNAVPNLSTSNINSNYNGQQHVTTNAIIITGCTDPTACNYDPAATADDGSCTGLFGCTDPTACNYNVNATCDDGSCTGVLGCTDPAANNHNALATCDDGSCFYNVNGCTDPTAQNYNSAATIDDGSCIYIGCTDPAACNYNPAAVQDDGSCNVCGDDTGINWSGTTDPSCVSGCTYCESIDPVNNLQMYFGAGQAAQPSAADQVTHLGQNVGVNVTFALTIPSSYDIQNIPSVTTGYTAWNGTQLGNVYRITYQLEEIDTAGTPTGTVLAMHPNIFENSIQPGQTHVWSNQQNPTNIPTFIVPANKLYNVTVKVICERDVDSQFLPAVFSLQSIPLNTTIL